MKKYYLQYFILALVLISALVIRLTNLDKAGGLWYDEMTIYSIASKSFPAGMMTEDLHRFLLFPLYFLAYKSWMIIFGNSDFAVRFMSVFFDMAGLICAYFVGTCFAQLINKHEVKNKIGLFNATLYAINSSFIYYAQEAKFYSLTFFLINLLIIFWLKMLKEPTRKNKIFFLVSNALLLYTYTSQLALILILQLATFCYLYINNKSGIKKHLDLALGSITVLLPLLVIILTNKDYFSGNFDAIVYDHSFILLVIQNWFSPILVGLQNNVLSYQWVVLSQILSVKWWLFVFFPVIFYLVLILKGSRKEPLSKLFLATGLSYLIFHLILSSTGKYAVLVRYVLPALPFFLPPAAYGLVKICSTNKGRVFFTLFLLVNLLALNSPIGATKIKRPDGYKALAEVLASNKITPESDFILPIRVSLLDKYYKIDGEKHSLYWLNSPEWQKTYLTDSEIEKINTKQNLYQGYRRFLLSHEISIGFKNLVETVFINKTKKGQKLVLITDLSICLYNDQMIDQIVSKENLYTKNPIQFLRLSKLNNNLIKVLSEKMRLEKVVKLNDWQIYAFSAK